jgi:hypothetical protein
MTLKTLIPAAMASIMGRMDHSKSVTVGGRRVRDLPGLLRLRNMTA